MKTVPTDFRKHGYRYHLLKRIGSVALYEQGGGCAYEVVKIRIAPERTFQGRTFPAGEYLPRTSEWGYAGWTLHTLGEAEAKLAGLVSLDKQNVDLAIADEGTGHCHNEPAAA